MEGDEDDDDHNGNASSPHTFNIHSNITSRRGSSRRKQIGSSSLSSRHQPQSQLRQGSLIAQQNQIYKDGQDKNGQKLKSKSESVEMNTSFESNHTNNSSRRRSLRLANKQQQSTTKSSSSMAYSLSPSIGPSSLSSATTSPYQSPYLVDPSKNNNSQRDHHTEEREATDNSHHHIQSIHYADDDNDDDDDLNISPSSSIKRLRLSLSPSVASSSSKKQQQLPPTPQLQKQQQQQNKNQNSNRKSGRTPLSPLPRTSGNIDHLTPNSGANSRFSRSGIKEGGSGGLLLKRKNGSHTNGSNVTKSPSRSALKQKKRKRNSSKSGGKRDIMTKILNDSMNASMKDESMHNIMTKIVDESKNNASIEKIDVPQCSQDLEEIMNEIENEEGNRNGNNAILESTILESNEKADNRMNASVTHVNTEYVQAEEPNENDNLMMMKEGKQHLSVVETIPATVAGKNQMKKEQLFQKITVPFPLNENVKEVEGENDGSITSKNYLEPKSLRHVYNHALQHGTHQRQLKESGCNLLSLDEVIIPTIMMSKIKSLRTMIGKARGKKDLDQVNQLQFMRSIVMSCSTNVSHQLAAYRMNQKTEREEKRIEHKNMILHQRAEKRKQRKERKKRQKMMERERRRKERRKNHPKNKELWREVMVLMTDLTRLEKEEKMWKSIDVETLIDDPSTRGSIISTSRTTSSAAMFEEKGGKVDNCALELNQNIIDVVDDVTLATNRINESLSSISNLMTESNNIRSEMNEMYKRDHKFHGYLGAKDPKALIRGLAL